MSNIWEPMCADNPLKFKKSLTSLSFVAFSIIFLATDISTPNLFSFLPVVILLCVCASIFGFTRTEMFATMFNFLAISHIVKILRKILCLFALFYFLLQK